MCLFDWPMLQTTGTLFETLLFFLPQINIFTSSVLKGQKGVKNLQCIQFINFFETLLFLLFQINIFTFSVLKGNIGS